MVCGLTEERWQCCVGSEFLGPRSLGNRADARGDRGEIEVLLLLLVLVLLETKQGLLLVVLLENELLLLEEKLLLLLNINKLLTQCKQGCC